MSYTVKLGSFAKHENSTAQPVMTSWASYVVVFKEGADLSAPVLNIAADFATLSGYNYAYMLNRYYWIRDIKVLRTGYCQLFLEVDVLATYKTSIGSSSMYILRSSAASNGNIRDNYYPTTSISYASSEDSTFYPFQYSMGNYIVNIVGIATSGTSTLWQLTPSNFRSLISALYTSIDGFQVTDILDAVSKFLDGSPEKLVSSAMWIPFSFTTSASQEIVIGTWHSGVYGQLISNPLMSYDVSLTIPKHPQASTRGAYLNLSPYSMYTLTIPMFGSVNVDTTAIKPATTLYLNIYVDAMTGQGSCYVHTGGNPRPPVALLNAQIGASVPLQGQSNGSSIAGGITSTLTGIAAAIATEGAAIPVIAAAGSGIGTAFSALSGASFSTGSMGGALAAQHAIRLDTTFLNIADEDNARNGRPYCQVSTPATLTGYMKAQKGDVQIAAPLPELDKIHAFLEGGFYYE